MIVEHKGPEEERVGTIRYVGDEGTVVVVIIDTPDGAFTGVGDGNLTRRSLLNMFGRAGPLGQKVRFAIESWVGLKYLAKVGDDDAEDDEG